MNTLAFEVVPTPKPDKTVNAGRRVINAAGGISMDVLMQIIEKHIPVVDESGEPTHTRKTVIRTVRCECPCCNTSLSALVSVECFGLITKPCKEVEGLYQVRISPDHGDCQVTVTKLRDEEIYNGRTALLPRKDYGKYGKKLAADIVTASERIAADPRLRNIHIVTGVETPDDFAAMVRDAVADQKKGTAPSS